MGSATNRNLAAKADLAKRQRCDAGAAEYEKPAYHTPAPAYDDTGVAVVRIEQPKRLIYRVAVVKPHCRTPYRPSWDEREHRTEILVSCRWERSKPLRGKAAERARLRQHF